MTKDEIFTHLVAHNGYEIHSKGNCYSAERSYSWKVAIADGKGIIYVSDEHFYFFNRDSFIKVDAEGKIFGYKMEAATPDFEQGKVQIFVSWGDGEQAFVYEISQEEILNFTYLVKAKGKHNIPLLRMNEAEGNGVDKRILKSEILNGATVTVVQKLGVVDFISEEMQLQNGQSRILNCTSKREN